MAATHSGADLFGASGTAVPAGTNQTSAVVNGSTAYGITLTAQIANGGTAPTVAASVTVMVSSDGVNFHQWAKDVAGLAASTTYSFGYELPKDIAYAQLVVGDNTGQAVTAFGQSYLTTGI